MLQVILAACKKQKIRGYNESDGTGGIGKLRECFLFVCCESLPSPSLCHKDNTETATTTTTWNCLRLFFTNSTMVHHLGNTFLFFPTTQQANLRPPNDRRLDNFLWHRLMANLPWQAIIPKPLFTHSKRFTSVEFLHRSGPKNAENLDLLSLGWVFYLFLDGIDVVFTTCNICCSKKRKTRLFFLALQLAKT